MWNLQSLQSGHLEKISLSKIKGKIRKNNSNELDFRVLMISLWNVERHDPELLHKALYTFLPLGLNTFNWKLDLSDGENSIQYHAISLSDFLISKVRIEQIIRSSFGFRLGYWDVLEYYLFLNLSSSAQSGKRLPFASGSFWLIEISSMHKCKQGYEGWAMVRVDRKSPLSESVKHMYKCVG